MGLLKIIRQFTDFKIRSMQWDAMEAARKSADMKRKETGRRHYVVMIDGKPLVMNTKVVNMLKKKKLLNKEFFAPMEAVYST